jgi:predicted metal-dependent hydrolase
MERMEIELVRGTRRRKHIEAVLVGDRLRVSFPRWMSLADAQRAAEELAERMRRRLDTSNIDIAARARKLARQYGLPRPKVVRWADNMRQRWGSCTPEDGVVRVSSRLAAYPAWVLDYVLMHELAHLVVGHHGPEHEALVDRYPYAERARGFLIAIDLDPVRDESPDDEAEAAVFAQHRDAGPGYWPLTPADVRP